MSRKPHSNSILKSLPQGKRKEIFERFLNPDMHYSELLYQLKAEGIECSKSTLYEFRSWYEAMRPILEANDFAQKFMEAIAADKSLSLDVSQINTIAQAAFEMQAVQQQDAKLFADLQRLRVQQDNASNQRRRLEQQLREYADKMKSAKDALEGVKSRGGLTQETLAQIEEAAKLL